LRTKLNPQGLDLKKALETKMAAILFKLNPMVEDAARQQLVITCSMKTSPQGMTVKKHRT